MPKLSIVITTKNRKQDLLECIDSITKSTFKDREIIIVDDVSTDGTEKLRSEDFNEMNVRIYHQEKPLMMVKARNFGAQKATGRYVLFIDDDNVIDEKMIEHLVEAADFNVEYGILGPAMFYFDTKEKYLDYQTFNFYSGRTRGLMDHSSRKLVDSDGVPNVFLIKREVFERLGHFDEKLIQTFTEPDFAFAVRSAYKCGIVKDAITYHKISKTKNARSFGGKFSQKAYCLMRNRTVLVARYGSWIQKLVYIACFSWLWPIVYSIFMLKERQFRLIKLYVHGFKDGIIYFFTKKFVNSLPNILTK
ncbi:glycosyltransferase family 2 protein [Patescibacteria group bacterium]